MISTERFSDRKIAVVIFLSKNVSVEVRLGHHEKGDLTTSTLGFLGWKLL